MAITNFTSKSVDRLTYKRSGAGWCVYWHRKLAGFGLRITQSGARTYVVRYRLRGSRAQKLKALGSSGKLTFGQAYDRAKEVLREAEQCRDWFDKAARERAQTLGQVWTYYSAEHLATDAVSPRTRNDAKSLWTQHCDKEFKNQSLADVTPERARDWHRRRTKEGPYVANRAAQALRAAWNYGLKYGRIPRELANPFASVKLNKETARQTILEPHQLPRFAKAANATSDPFARAYIWLAFYTGCRRTELLTLKWTDVMIEPARKDQPRAGIISLRETKGGEPRRVALSAPAIQILEEIPRTTNPYVFVGAVTDTHLDPKEHWNQVRRAAGLPELRLHDLRRSLGSWLGATGFSTKQIGALLGHKTEITSRVYVQLGEAANVKRQLVTAHALLAEEFLKEKPLAELVDLRERV